MDFGSGHTITLQQRRDVHAPELAQAFSAEEFRELVQKFKQVYQLDPSLFQDWRLFQLVHEVTAGLVGQQCWHVQPLL